MHPIISKQCFQSKVSLLKDSCWNRSTLKAGSTTGSNRRLTGITVKHRVLKMQYHLESMALSYKWTTLYVRQAVFWILIYAQGYWLLFQKDHKVVCEFPSLCFDIEACRRKWWKYTCWENKEISSMQSFCSCMCAVCQGVLEHVCMHVCPQLYMPLTANAVVCLSNTNT